MVLFGDIIRLLSSISVQELQLCEQYDAHMAEWERGIDKIESSSKKK